MTADFDMDMTLTGTADELYAMLMVFKKYDESISKVYFSLPRVSKVLLSIGEHVMDMDETAIRNFVTENEGTIFISAGGPYGRYALLNEVDVFRKMAEAAPGATFKASIDGTNAAMAQRMECILENNLLRTEFWCEDFEDVGNAYVDYFLRFYSYNKFVENFGLDSDFSEENYRELIWEHSYDICVNVDFEEFTEWMDVYTSAEINEDDFDTFMDDLENSGILDRDSYEEDFSAGESEITVYDPVKKCRVF